MSTPLVLRQALREYPFFFKVKIYYAQTTSRQQKDNLKDIYINTHTHAHTSLNPPIMFSMPTSTSSLLGKQLSSSSSKHLRKQQKQHNKINVKVSAMSNVSRNPNMAQLRAGYLFPEIARIRNAHLEKNPDAKIISLGIGDTTVRFCFGIR